MIVEHQNKGWRIVSHYAHGLLAGKLANALRLDLRPSQWIDVLTAIIEHDDHLLDFGEQNYLTEIGTPLDYRMSSGTDEEILEHAERVYKNALQKSQMVGMLIGRHLVFLNTDLAKQYAPMKRFITMVEDRSKVQRRIYGLNKKKENSIYDIMRFCDRCSLILCQNQVPTIGRKLEINATIDNKTYFIHRGSEDNLSIEPWPFEETKFVMNYEYKILSESSFGSNTELENVLSKADIHLDVLNFEK